MWGDGGGAWSGRDNEFKKLGQLLAKLYFYLRNIETQLRNGSFLTNVSGVIHAHITADG